MSKPKRHIEAQIVKAAEGPVQKADVSTEISDRLDNTALWISKPAKMEGFRRLRDESSILPQCINSYRNNIAGFGIGIRYKNDEAETEEMRAEYIAMEKLLDLMNTDMDTKEIFQNVIVSRETYGIAYIEVIRDLMGNVTQFEFIEDTPSVTKSVVLDPYIDIEYYYNGEKINRKKRFRKYQQTRNGKTIYFKEFGDPRVMDNRNGDYIDGGEGLTRQYHANEIFEFKIGTDNYGLVRWIGQVLGVDGARKAENLNNRYFEDGRHTPLAIIVRGGTLSEKSYEKMQEYMNNIKGENGQHAFLLLEVEETEDTSAFEGTGKPEVELKDLASILQKDELFQEYLNNNRKKVQSSFMLPDLYVGYTTDFNRATAQTAIEVTEQQVFQPERLDLAWAINNKLLNGYNFRHVEMYFKAPKISNPDDLVKILNVTERAGGLTPNKAKQITLDAIGEVSEDYAEEWGNTPLAYSKTMGGEKTSVGFPSVPEQLEKAIEKAEYNKDMEIVAVMKEVRALLERGTSDV